jgi:hypothetical protein
MCGSNNLKKSVVLMLNLPQNRVVNSNWNGVINLTGFSTTLKDWKALREF